jgi:hypothetical protein
MYEKEDKELCHNYRDLSSFLVYAIYNIIITKRYKKVIEVMRSE